jgi:hypothetical protein
LRCGIDVNFDAQDALRGLASRRFGNQLKTERLEL